MNAIEEMEKLKEAGLEERPAAAIVNLVARHNDELVTKDYLDAALERRFLSVEKQLSKLDGKLTILLIMIPACIAFATLVLGWILSHSKFTG